MVRGCPSSQWKWTRGPLKSIFFCPRSFASIAAKMATHAPILPFQTKSKLTLFWRNSKFYFDTIHIKPPPFPSAKPVPFLDGLEVTKNQTQQKPWEATPGLDPTPKALPFGIAMAHALRGPPEAGSRNSRVARFPTPGAIVRF